MRNDKVQNLLDNKICTFKILLSNTFPKNSGSSKYCARFVLVTESCTISCTFCIPPHLFRKGISGTSRDCPCVLRILDNFLSTRRKPFTWNLPLDRKTTFWTIFPLCPLSPPPSKTPNFIFIVVSPSLILESDFIEKKKLVSVNECLDNLSTQSIPSHVRKVLKKWACFCRADEELVQENGDQQSQQEHPTVTGDGRKPILQDSSAVLFLVRKGPLGKEPEDCLKTISLRLPGSFVYVFPLSPRERAT